MITLTIHKCFICKAEDSIFPDFNAGQVVCINCGTVHDDRIVDETSEWRNFNSENGGSNSDPNRVGGPINPYLDEMNLMTNIVVKKGGTLSKWSQRTLGSGVKSLYRIFKKVDELAAKLDLPLSIIEKSKDIIIKVDKSNKIKGRSIDSIVASVFFQACRKCNAPRTLKDIVEHLHLEKKDVSRCFNSIKHIITDPNENPISINVLGLIHLYCNKMEIPNNIKKTAGEIAEEVCNKELIAGKNPSTIATASIYFAIRLHKNTKFTKKNISEQSKITENTINTAFQQLYSVKDIITPTNLKHLLVNLENN